MLSRQGAGAYSNRVEGVANIGKAAIVGVILAVLLVLIVLPLASLFRYGLSSATWNGASSSEALATLGFALLLGIATTVTSLVVGTAVALALQANEKPLRGALKLAVELPAGIPAAATGLTLLLLYGPMGMLHAAGSDLRIIFLGILTVHVLVTLPHVVKAVDNILRKMDMSEVEAARALGADGGHVFFLIFPPATKTGLVVGSVLTFARSVGEFGVTVMVAAALALPAQAGRPFIFSDFSISGIQATASLSVVLVFVSAVLFLGTKLMVRVSNHKEETIAKHALS